MFKHKHHKTIKTVINFKSLVDRPLHLQLARRWVNMVSTLPNFANVLMRLQRIEWERSLLLKFLYMKTARMSLAFMKVTPASVLPMKAQAKRFGKPLTEKVGKVNKDQIREIAEKKMPDLNAHTIEAA